MKVSISTGSLLPYPLPLALRWAARAGFEGVEWVVGPELLWGGAAWVCRQARQAGLRIFSVHPPFLRAGPWADDGLLAARLVELAAELGASLTMVHPPDASHWDEPAAQRYRQGLEAGRDAAQRLGVRLAIETAGRSWTGRKDRLLLNPEELAAFVEEWDLAVVLDSTHVGTLDPTLQAAEVLLGPRLAGVHLSDMTGEALGETGGLHRRFTSTHRMPGEGILPLRSLLGSLVARGFQGPITLEVNPLELGVLQPGRVRHRLEQAVQFVLNGREA